MVVAEHSKPLDGKTVEVVGHYDPTSPAKPFVVDKEAVSKWIEKGAKPSNTVAWLLNKHGGFNLPVEQRPARKPRKELKAEAKPEEGTGEPASPDGDSGKEAALAETAEATGEESKPEEELAEPEEKVAEEPKAEETAKPVPEPEAAKEEIPAVEEKPAETPGATEKKSES